MGAHDLDKRWLSVAEAVQCTGLSRSTLNRAFVSGRLPRYKAGRRVLLRRSELDAFIGQPVNSALLAQREYRRLNNKSAKDYHG